MRLKKIINIYGGPSIGKSTIASGIFYDLKMKHHNVEYVSEYAKELTYDKRMNILFEDQLYIFAKQHRMIYRLKDQVDYIIIDSPLPLILSYFCDDKCIYDYNIFKQLVLSTYNSYPNLNILLKRNPDIPYSTDGRKETQTEAINIDENIKQSLIKNNIAYAEIIANENSVDKIIRISKI